MSQACNSAPGAPWRQENGSIALLEHTGGQRDLLGVKGGPERRERGREDVGNPWKCRVFEGPKVRSHK